MLKKEPELIEPPSDATESIKIYEEAVDAMNLGDYFYASKKFKEAENIMQELNSASF